MEIERVKLKINVALAGRPAGAVFDVLAVAPGIPASPFWRRRLRDAERDGCCQIVTDEPKRKAAKTVEPPADDGGE